MCENFRHSLRLGLYDDFVNEAIDSPEYYEINRYICVKQYIKKYLPQLYKEFDEYVEHKNVQ